MSSFIFWLVPGILYVHQVLLANFKFISSYKKYANLQFTISRTWDGGSYLINAFHDNSPLKHIFDRTCHPAERRGFVLIVTIAF